MIEEIKKEINEKVNDYFWKQGCKNEEVFIKIKKIYNGVLNKYKHKDDVAFEEYLEINCRHCEDRKYKKAWEELYSENEKPCSIEYMQDLEEKYKIEVE